MGATKVSLRGGIRRTHRGRPIAADDLSCLERRQEGARSGFGVASNWPDCVRDFRFKRHYQFVFAFEREGRASDHQKQDTVTLRRGAEASSSLKRNKWGQPVGGNVYAGFELELAGAERSGAASRKRIQFPNAKVTMATA
jgi:hypothetical protein